MYITYDLPQISSDNKRAVIRGAKEVSIQGEILDWQVGEFETASGTKASGVQVNFRKESERRIENQVIDVPAHAQNVQVHIGSIPSEYQSALGTAA